MEHFLKMKYRRWHWRISLIDMQGNSQILDNGDGEENCSFMECYEDLLIFYFREWGFWQYTFWINGETQPTPVYLVWFEIYLEGGEKLIMDPSAWFNNWTDLDLSWLSETLEVSEATILYAYGFRERFITNFYGAPFYMKLYNHNINGFEGV